MAALLAIGLLDELVFGAREAAWPLVRDDLSLSYAEIGLLLAVPGLVSVVVEPVLGLLAVTWQRRLLVLAGGVAFAASLATAAVARSPWVLLAAFSVLYPASGAFVALSQASLMDLEPERREQNMARWTFAGAVGAVGGPLALALFAWAGLGWRGLFLALAVVSAALVLLVRGADGRTADEEERPRVREALRALTRREVFRWLLLLELSDLLLDAFAAFLALYLVDVAGTSTATAGVGVAVWSAAALVGSGALVVVLRRVDGLRYLRVSAVAAGVLLVAFLVVPTPAAKLVLVGAIALVNAGWYPVLKARLYAALGDASGLVLVVGALFPLNAVLPLGLALLADRVGLGTALWLLLAAPAALLVFGRPMRR